MARIPLTLGSYQARSIIASARRWCNLYQERNPDGSPVPFTYYPCPGLRLLASGPLNSQVCGHPLCQRSCRLNRIGTFGGADSRKWLDTDKRTKIG